MMNKYAGDQGKAIICFNEYERHQLYKSGLYRDFDLHVVGANIRGLRYNHVVVRMPLLESSRYRVINQYTTEFVALTIVPGGHIEYSREPLSDLLTKVKNTG